LGCLPAHTLRLARRKHLKTYDVLRLRLRDPAPAGMAATW
jgi:hypothetical protein